MKIRSNEPPTDSSLKSSSQIGRAIKPGRFKKPRYNIAGEEIAKVTGVGCLVLAVQQIFASSTQKGYGQDKNSI